MPHVTVNGISMYYELTGEGEPLVWINGLGGDSSETALLSEPLAQHHRVLNFDNRGAGRTDMPDEPYTVEQMAQDTCELMRAVGFSSAAVVGVSMGGRIALHLALEHPDMVTRLALVSTGARTIPTRWRSVLFGVLPRLPLFKGKHPQPYYAFSRQRVASSSYDCVARLPEISLPTGIFHGKSDRIAPTVLATELHAGIRGSRLTFFSGGHIFFLVRERLHFLAELEAFLGDEPGRKPNPPA